VESVIKIQDICLPIVKRVAIKTKMRIALVGQIRVNVVKILDICYQIVSKVAKNIALETDLLYQKIELFNDFTILIKTDKFLSESILS